MEAGFDILLLSPEQDIAYEAEILNRLFNLGLTSFHLRNPKWSLEQVEQILNNVPAEFHNRIVLHSHFELTDKFELKGIHLNEANKKLISQFVQYPIISASFHSVDDIKENTFPYQYIFLGPIFNSISKAGYKSTFELSVVADELALMKKKNPSLPKVIALGGINSDNISKVKSAGFSGAAILGAVWQSSDPLKALAEIRSKIDAK